MKKIILFLIVLLWGSATYAQFGGSDCELLLNSGNAEYNKGNYEKAAKMYKQLQSQCAENYGGCAAKMQDCRRKIKESIAYKNCTSVEACDAYLKMYPNGRYVSQVRSQRAEWLELIESKAPLHGNKWSSALKKCTEHVTESYSNGSYKGQLKDGEREGQGMCAYENGSYYIGDWSLGMMDGCGMYICSENETIPNCPDCKYFCGQFSDGVISGNGSCYNRDGDLIYRGDFVDGIPTGEYPMVEQSDSKFDCIKCSVEGYYLGETSFGKRNGRGVFIWCNGDMLYSEWFEGERKGEGIYLSYGRKESSDVNVLANASEESPIESLKKLTIRYHVFTDQPNVYPESFLESMVLKLRRMPNVIIVIEHVGYSTWEVDSEDAARDLILRRINRLKDLFVSKGVNPEQIELHTFAADEVDYLEELYRREGGFVVGPITISIKIKG